MIVKYFWALVSNGTTTGIFGFRTEAEAREEGMRRKAAGARVSLSPVAMTTGEMIRALDEAGIIPETYRY